MMKNRVSILIPCYNAERWVGQAVRSALDQTQPGVEVIVVDDGSTDRSLDVIKSFGARIRWESGPNRGGNVARNRLLELSRGEWLQYLDADDYLLADKIRRQLEFVEGDTGRADVVFGPTLMEYYSESGSRREVLPIPEPHDPWILLARWDLPQTGSPLWRRRAILDVGGWKADQPCCQELELYLRLLKAGKKFAYFDYPGSVYRQWSEETVSKKDIPEMLRRRSEVTDGVESCLERSGNLTRERQDAVNEARFECARNIWNFDRALASEIMKKVLSRDAGFTPGTPAARPSYKLIYKLFGFEMAETLARIKRKILT